MGTTAEKSAYLNTTKSKIRTSLNNLGAELTENDTFRSYANVLADIYEDLPKVSAEGTDLELSNTKKGKLNLTPKGSSSQDGEPTPTTPIPVQSVTGENSLIISNENLFDGELEYGQLNQNNGTPQGSATDRKRTKNFINVENINEVTLSFSVITSSSAYGRFFLYDKEYNMLSNTQIAGNTKTVNVENAYYVKWWASDTVDYETFMLVKGSTAPTTYVEHEEQNYQLSLGNIELNSSPDGTIRDGIYGTPDNWKKKQFIQKIVLNGSESYGKNASGTGFISFTLSNYITSIDKTVSSNLFSNILQSIASGNVANTCRIAASGRIVLTFSDTFCDYDLTALSAKLQTMYNNNNPLILYIPLAQYIDIPITDSTLISQLNDLYENAKSYNGVTNITTTYEDGNEQMVLDASALKSWSES